MLKQYAIPTFFAIPTSFAHNKDKQTQKRKPSAMREEAKAKRQLCECLHQEEVDRFKFECNTNEKQTEIIFESVVTCIEKVDFGVQCYIETLSEQQNASEAETEVNLANTVTTLMKVMTLMTEVMQTQHLILKGCIYCLLDLITNSAQKRFASDLLVASYYIKFCIQRLPADHKNETPNRLSNDMDILAKL